MPPSSFTYSEIRQSPTSPPPHPIFTLSAISPSSRRQSAKHPLSALIPLMSPQSDQPWCQQHVRLWDIPIPSQASQHPRGKCRGPPCWVASSAAPPPWHLHPTQAKGPPFLCLKGCRCTCSCVCRSACVCVCGNAEMISQPPVSVLGGHPPCFLSQVLSMRPGASS